MEQWFIYQAFVEYDPPEVTKFFRDAYPGFSIADLQTLLGCVQMAHEYVSLGEVAPFDVPAYSPRGGVWEMYSPLHKKLEITWNFERFLLASFKTGNIHDINTVAHYFKEYREKWGITTRYKKDQKSQDMQLAGLFLNQHGLKERSITKKKEPNPFEYKEPETLKESLYDLLGFILLMIVYAIPLFIMTWIAEGLTSFDNFIGSLLGFLCLILGIFWPVLIFIYKK